MRITNKMRLEKLRNLGIHMAWECWAKESGIEYYARGEVGVQRSDVFYRLIDAAIRAGREKK